jgi:magnesium transporter
MSKNGTRNQHAKMRLRRRGKAGSPPGTVSSDPSAQATTVRVMCYSPNAFHEQAIVSIGDLKQVLAKWPMVWIDVSGLGTIATILQLGELLHLHPLALEDAVNVHQRSKVDAYVDHLFIVARMCNRGEGHLTEQVSFFLKAGVLITFQERAGDCWDPVRERIRGGRGNLRTSGVDYLAYTLLDAVVDSYFPAVDAIGEQLDKFDEQLDQADSQSRYQGLHEVRHQLLGLRRSIRPHRDMINELIRDDLPLISIETRVFLRDCFDHVIQLLDLVDTYRELTADLREYQMSLNSHRMNEIMKVLTVISTIFMPLSFIAGLYGMNFDGSPWNMPELHWRYGYLFAIGLMVATVMGMLWYFRRKGWF